MGLYKGDNAPGRKNALYGLIATGVAFALVLWAGFVAPISLMNYYQVPHMDPWFLRVKGTPMLIHVILTFAILGVAYLLGYRWALQAKGKAAWIVVIAGMLAFSAILVYMQPFGSNDIFDNISHGRIFAIYHANPFKQVPQNYPGDPFTRYVGWLNVPSAYGPLWELLAGLTAKLAGDGIVQNVIAFKVLSGLFLLGSIGMVVLILREKLPNYALPGTLLLAWNPVVLFHVWGNGHNDMAMVFWILVAVWAVSHRHFTSAILALIVGGLFKYIPVMLIPAAGLVSLSALPDWKSRGRFIAITAVLGVILIVAAYKPFWFGTSTLSVTRRMQLFTTSLTSSIFFNLQKNIGFTKAANLVSRAAAGATFLFAGWQALRALRSHAPDRFLRAAFFSIGFYLLVTVLWFFPWYTLWLIALAPLLEEPWLRRVAVLFGMTALAKDLIVSPIIWWNPNPPDMVRVEMYYALGVFILPWTYIMYHLLEPHLGRVQQWSEAFLVGFIQARSTPGVDGEQ